MTSPLISHTTRRFTFWKASSTPRLLRSIASSTRKKIENEIRKRLTEKGLLEVESKPDLNVRFTLGQARKTEVEAYPAGWRGLGTRRVRVAYTQGTLVINLRDPSRKELVWRSIAVEEKDDPAQISQHLDDMVRKSIEKYPPKK